MKYYSPVYFRGLFVNEPQSVFRRKLSVLGETARTDQSANEKQVNFRMNEFIFNNHNQFIVKHIDHGY